MRSRQGLRALLRVLTVLGIGGSITAPGKAATSIGAGSVGGHDFEVKVVAQGLNHPWGQVFLQHSVFLVTERPGFLRRVTEVGEVGPPLAGLPSITAHGQGGLLDI